MISYTSDIQPYLDLIHREPDYPDVDYPTDIIEVLWWAGLYPDRCRKCGQYPEFSFIDVAGIKRIALECDQGTHILQTGYYKNVIRTVLCWNMFMKNMIELYMPCKNLTEV